MQPRKWDKKGGCLQGIRVVDLTSTVLGPVATQILGDLGADVVKIESPEGDSMRNLGPSRNPGMAAMFLAMNRNKRSVVLNLKQEVSKQVFRHLVAQADVVVHNMRLQAAERLGIAYAQLSGSHPRLVYASASGYRRSGPNRDLPAFDELIQSVSGISGLFMRAGERARYAPFVIADKVAGYTLASSIIAALFERERSGLGQEVEVPMFETLVEFNLIEHFWGRAFVPPLGEPGYPRILTPERRPFETKDGYICVAVTTDAQWERLFNAIGRPDLARDPRFEKMAQRTFHFEEAFRYLNQALPARTTAEWIAAFNAADLPCGPANELEDLFDSPYLHQTGFFNLYDHPSEGRLVASNPSVTYSRTPSGMRLPPPRLGEHTREIMQQAGFAEADICLVEKQMPARKADARPAGAATQETPQ